MRIFPLPVAIAGALIGAACTNDYDAFLEQASGGASGTSTATAATASTSDASSSSDSAATSSASTAATTSGQSSGGGDGGGGGTGGNGGSGGTGPGGGGGSGGEASSFPGEDPCNIVLALDVDVADLDDEDGELPDGWDYDEEGGPESEIANETFIIGVDSSGFARAELRFVLDPPETFSDCSISTSVIGFSGAEAGTQLAGFLGVLNGDEYLARVRIINGAPLRHDVQLGDRPEEMSVAPGIDDGAPPSRIRIRAHDASISFDVGVGSTGWKRIHTMPREEVGDIDAIALGGARQSPGGEDDLTEIILGPLNASP